MRGRNWLAFLLVLALLGPQPAAHAQAISAPQRMRVDALEYPWSAVGRLNIAGRVWCSAVLVSERQILTAAHCLWNPIRQEWWPAGSVHFVAGYQGGEAPLHSLVKNYRVADGNRSKMPPAVDPNATDWAVADLEEPLGRLAGWLAVGTITGKTTLLGQLGYRADSAHALTLDYGCRLVGIADAGRLFWDDCDAAHGDSGGPVLAFLPEGPRVVGISIASVKSPTQSITLAISMMVLDDPQHFPTAAQLTGGVGKSAQPPPAGGMIAVLPLATLAALGKAETTPPSMALLTELLARHSVTKP